MSDEREKMENALGYIEGLIPDAEEIEEESSLNAEQLDDLGVVLGMLWIASSAVSAEQKEVGGYYGELWKAMLNLGFTKADLSAATDQLVLHRERVIGHAQIVFLSPENYDRMFGLSDPVRPGRSATEEAQIEAVKRTLSHAEQRIAYAADLLHSIADSCWKQTGNDQALTSMLYGIRMSQLVELGADPELLQEGDRLMREAIDAQRTAG